MIVARLRLAPAGVTMLTPAAPLLRLAPRHAASPPPLPSASKFPPRAPFFTWSGEPPGWRLRRLFFASHQHWQLRCHLCARLRRSPGTPPHDPEPEAGP